MDKDGKYTMDVYSTITDASNSYRIRAQPPRQRRQNLIGGKQSDNFESTTCEWSTVKVRLFRTNAIKSKEYSYIPGSLCPNEVCEGIKNESVIE
jgi:hypothetical protein